MQCGNCQFENMPGSEVCGRCGTSMALAHANIDVEPPRAHSWNKGLRRLGRRSRDWKETVSSVAGRIETSWERQTWREVPRVGLLVRLPIPGWAHYACGLRGKGLILLTTYFALLLFGLTLWDVPPGLFFLGLAFTVHVYAAVDILRWGEPKDLVTFIGYPFLVSFVLAMGLYLPAGALLTHFFGPPPEITMRGH